MHSRLKWSVCLLGLAAMFVAVGVPARAQDKQHVVSLGDLNKDAARPAETRQANEEAEIRQARLPKGGQGRWPIKRCRPRQTRGAFPAGAGRFCRRAHFRPRSALDHRYRARHRRAGAGAPIIHNQQEETTGVIGHARKEGHVRFVPDAVPGARLGGGASGKRGSLAGCAIRQTKRGRLRIRGHFHGLAVLERAWRRG